MRHLFQPAPGSRRSRLAALCAALLATSVGALAAPVDDTAVFELDNNAVDASSPAGDDWGTIAGSGGSALRASFFSDPVNLSTDDNFAGGGSKDERDIGSAGITNTYWQNTLTTPPDKNDLEHAFAAAYDVAGDLVIYFGADRYSNSGDSAIGFWFFKGDVTDNPNGTFSGKHTVGDILVTSDFKQGGSASVINVFRWTGNAANPLQLVASSSTGGGSVDPTTKVFCLTSGNACAVANPVPVAVPASWGGYSFKGAGAVTSFPQGTFFEGGINVSALFPGGGNCFASFMAMTRTSASTTAQLKDYVLGSFPLCGISVGTSCQVNEFSPVINSDGQSINTRFAVPVTNTGAGTVFDIAIEQDSALPGPHATSCRVISPVASSVLASDSAVAVFTSLAAGATSTAIIECDSQANPLVNAVTARAKSSSGAATRDLEASYTAGQGGETELCPVNPDPSITAIKQCATSIGAPEGVKLKVGGGFEVCVNISVTNNSVEALKSVSIVDSKIGALLTGGSMNPGQTLTYNNRCYDATNADSGETNPAEAAFSDRVDVSGLGVISNEPVGDPALPEATATCKLCPTCPDCGS